MVWRVCLFISAINHPEKFSYFEFQGVYLNSVAKHKEIIDLLVGFGGAAGLLKHENENSFLLNFKFEIGPSFFNDILMFIVTTGPALITRSHFSNQDF